MFNYFIFIQTTMITVIKPIKVIKHKEVYYRRWMNFNQRCNNVTIEDYGNYGGKGIAVDRIWCVNNPFGYLNFRTWLLEEIEKNPSIAIGKFKVGRKNILGNYSPENCYLIKNVIVCQNRTTNVLTFAKVIEMRKFKKSNPQATLHYMSLKYEQSITNVSRCLRGITWSNVNSTESPIKRSYG